MTSQEGNNNGKGTAAEQKEQWNRKNNGTERTTEQKEQRNRKNNGTERTTASLCGTPLV
jgi:hypothetical protein